MSKTDVALWCYKCMGWIGIGVDGCTGGVMYRAAYGANKSRRKQYKWIIRGQLQTESRV